MKKTSERAIDALISRSLCIITFLAIFTIGSSEGAHAAKYELVESPRAVKFRQVRVSVSVKGELRLNPDGSEIRKMPVQVKGDLYYDEQRFSGKQSLRATRYYRQAQAEIEIGTFKIKPSLADSHRIMALAGKEDARPLLFSPAGPLTREELELIDVQGNSVLLDHLLPEQAVAVGDKWQISDTALATLLNVDGISSAKVSSRLTEVKDNVAVISMEGAVSGAVGGVSTEIDLKAKYNFDFKAKQITWFALAVHEKRAIGHAEPGLDVVAQIRMALRPIQQSQHLRNCEEAVSSASDKSKSSLLSCVSNDGGYRMVYDRRWKITRDSFAICRSRRPSGTRKYFTPRGSTSGRTSRARDISSRCSKGAGGEF